MIGNIVGIDISTEAVTAVLAKKSFKELEILDCVRESIKTDSVDSVAKALSFITEKLDVTGASAICTIPSSKLVFRNIEMPFSDTKKISQTISFELESLLANPIDELEIDFAATKQDAGSGANVLAAGVNRDYLTELIQVFEENGIDPDVIDVASVPVALHLIKHANKTNFILLDFNDNNLTLCICNYGHISGLRAINLGQPYSTDSEGVAEGNSSSAINKMQNVILTTVKAYCTTYKLSLPDTIYLAGYGFWYDLMPNELLEIDGIAVSVLLVKDEKINQSPAVKNGFNSSLFTNCISNISRDNVRWRGFNFRKGKFGIHRPFLKYKKEMIKACALATLFVILFITQNSLENSKLQATYDQLKQQQTEIYQRNFPEDTRIIDPLHQMNAKIRALKKQRTSIRGTSVKGNTLDLLADLSGRISSQTDIVLTRMVVDEDSIHLVGKTDNFNTVDEVKKSLDASVYFKEVTIHSANLDKKGSGVLFEIRLTR